MGGKKWCEYCRININYNKKDIQEHEQTRMHLHNKQKTIKWDRIKIQQAEKEQQQARRENVLLGTANLFKAKKGSKLEQQVQAYRDNVYSQGKAAIHNLIASATQGMYGAPIEFDAKEDLVLADNFKNKEAEGSDSEVEYQMWRIDICEETGDPCFINNITKVKYYEPPKGHVMTDKQREEWEQLVEMCKEKVNPNAENQVVISGWEEVPQEDDYFKMNQVVDSMEEQVPVVKEEQPQNKRSHGQAFEQVKQEVKQEQKPADKSWAEKLEEQINNNQVSANEVMDTVIYNKLRQARNLKQKNETVKTLIRGDLEIRQTVDEGNRQMQQVFGEQKKTNVGFKPKKKVKTTQISI